MSGTEKKDDTKLDKKENDEDDKPKPSTVLQSCPKKRNSITEGIEALTSFLADKLNLSAAFDSKKKVEPEGKTEATVDDVVEYILSGDCKNIITMVGAGISTYTNSNVILVTFEAAGIPDFRSPGSGLYHNLKKYDLPHPEAIFSLDFFHMNAKPFFELAKELYPGTFSPTKSHYFIKLLEDKGLLLRHYTQNIDTLERVAKISDEKLVEAHGTFHLGHCLGCKKEYTQDWMKDKIFEDIIPICDDCPGVVKPDIVFFGENLPRKFFQHSNKDFKNCDLLIVMGSSLVVQPFASLVDRVNKDCRRLLINREEAGNLSFGPNSTTDVFLPGDCDEQCQIFADKLGWGDELKELMKSGHDAIEKEKISKKKKIPAEE